MKKSLISTIAVSLIAASFFSVTTVKSVNADEFGKCGKQNSYNKAMAAANYALSLKDKSYDQMPDPVKINNNWCAAFTKYLYGITEKYCFYNSVTQTCNYYKDRGLYHSKDSGYIPGKGDLIVYEESGNTGDGYEHIGIVVNTKYINGEYYPETIEGNYFDLDWNGDITNMSINDYGGQASQHYWRDRKVGFVPYNRVRRQMVVGYIEADRKSINYIYGDVNADGKVNPADATLILRAILIMDTNGGVLNDNLGTNLSVAELYYRLDADGDGKIKPIDATIVSRYSLMHDMRR